VGILCLAVAALCPAARAHEDTIVYVTVELAPAEVRVAVALRPADLIQHFGLDLDGDGELSGEELSAGEPGTAGLLADRVRVWHDFTPLALAPAGSRAIEGGSRPLIAFDFTAPLRRPPADLALEVDLADRLGSRSVSVVKVVDGDRQMEAILDAAHPRRSFDMGRPLSLAHQVVGFTKLGVEHIFLGFDHILFLLALILTGHRLGALLRIVTAFTAAHSATLVLAALDVVRLPPRWVEASIAFTIAYVAAENLWSRRQGGERWKLAFGFGLIHGFGFANVLRDLGLPRRGLVASLLAFNVGVEVGQVCIVVLAFPLAFWLARQSFRRTALQMASAVILVVALGWLLERALGLELMPL
jgi:hypothetical protein